MGRTWSERALREQRSINQWVLEQEHRQARGVDARRLQYPTLVKVVSDIAPNARGECTFMEGGLGGLSETEEGSALMYNLVNSSKIPANAICLAQRVTLPWSGEAGWVLIRSLSSTQTTVTEASDCEACFGRVLPASMDLKISGVTDGSAAAGTAALLGTTGTPVTHTLTTAQFATFTNCSVNTSISNTAHGSGTIVITLRPVFVNWQLTIEADDAAWRSNFTSVNSKLPKVELSPAETGGVPGVEILVCEANYVGPMNTHWGTRATGTGTPPDFSGATFEVNP